MAQRREWEKFWQGRGGEGLKENEDSGPEQEESESKENDEENHREIPELLLLKKGSIRPHDAVRAGEGMK